MLFSYDYEELLQELKQDIVEFNIAPDDDLYIVRGEKTLNDYRPIIDYYIVGQKIDALDRPIRVKAKDVIDEMEKMNSILGGEI